MSESREQSIKSLQGVGRTFPPPPAIAAEAHINSLPDYEAMWKQSIEEPESFWLDQAKTLDWFTFPKKSLEYTWDTKARKIEHTWFADGELNVSYNCIDRHLGTPRENKVALLWQGEPEDEVIRLTYKELHTEVCKFANVLKAEGIKKGDRVCIYLPMIIELPIVMLACTRIGAIHSIVFGGFSADAISSRVLDAECKMLVTSNVSLRAGKHIPLKQISDDALASDGCKSIESVIVVKRNDAPCNFVEGRDKWYADLVATASADCAPEKMNAEDPLFILYTSGSTGKPKGVVHTTGGYLLQMSITHKLVFDLKEEDTYWCSADIGWVTGHSYIVYGPLANGATSVMFEGVPTYPDAGRFWQVCEKFKVTQFYTAPTAIRALMQKGTEFVEKHDLSGLRILGSVGEPINPEAWMWYHQNVGGGKCPIVDTWWQTETGGFMITPLPGVHTLKPGCANRPFFGVNPVILRDDRSEADVNEGGKLCITKPWPSIMRTMWGDHDRFVDTYFTMFEDMYFTGDGARKDADGDIWLMGRIDDVVNVSGHRIGTAEVESALVSHEQVAEAAVAPMPHEIKGQGLYAFVTLMNGVEESEELRKELVLHVRKEIGPIAAPDFIQFAPALPKTRSGKIMRRILRKIAEDAADQVGDTTTLADPSVVEQLIDESHRLRQK